MKQLLYLLFLMLSFLLYSQEPEWEWAAQGGGIGFDEGRSITIDDFSNNYVTGSFYDTAIFGSYSLVSSEDSDIFVAKMDANGNWLWATQAGGSSLDKGFAIAVDDNGCSYVTGYFRETAVFGSYSLACSGGVNIFVAKLDANGNWLWANQAEGIGWDISRSITLDTNGSSYITGRFNGTVTFGSFSLTSIGGGNGEGDIFVAKVDADGNWQWATQAGGYGFSESGYAITIDNNNNCYVAGNFESIATFNSISLTSIGYSDIFVAKIDQNGNWLWATQAGSINDDIGYGISIDDNCSSYVTGNFGSTATFGSFSLTCSGNRDIFVAKIDANGNWLWATQAGGTSYDKGSAIVIDDDFSSYVTGNFMETATFGSFSITSNESSDIFVAKVDANGDWLWVTQAGSLSSDMSYGVSIDNNCNSYVTGSFYNTATFGLNSLTSFGDSDIFVAKLGSETFVENEMIPTKTELSNYPNPFNPSTTIQFSIQNDSNVKLSIYNIKGQKIKILAQNKFLKGSYSLVWNGDDENGQTVGSGVYLYKLYINGKIGAMKKCLLLK